MIEALDGIYDFFNFYFINEQGAWVLFDDPRILGVIHVDRRKPGMNRIKKFVRKGVVIIKAPDFSQIDTQSGLLHQRRNHIGLDPTQKNDMVPYPS